MLETIFGHEKNPSCYLDFPLKSFSYLNRLKSKQIFYVCSS